MISWLETVPLSTGLVQSSTGSSSALAPTQFTNFTNVTSETFYTSQNWSRIYTSSSRAGSRWEQNPTPTIIDLATSDENEQTAQTFAKTTSSTSTYSLFVKGSNTIETTKQDWSYATSASEFYSLETPTTTLWEGAIETTQTRTTTTTSGTQYGGNGVAYNTIYQATPQPVIVGAIQAQQIEQVFLTVPQESFVSSKQLLGQSASRFTALAYTETEAAQQTSAILSAGNSRITHSFTYRHLVTTATTIDAESGAFRLPKTLTSATSTTQTTAGSTYQTTFLHSEDSTIPNPVTTTVYYRSVYSATELGLGNLVYDTLVNSTASATRHTAGQKQITTASGSNFGYSVSETCLKKGPLICTTDRADATRYRTIYGRAGRKIGSSLGAAFDLQNLNTTFFVQNETALVGRQAPNENILLEIGYGSMVSLFPTSHTYEFENTSQTLSIGSGQYFATHATTNTTSTTTSGQIGVTGSTYVKEYRVVDNYGGGYHPSINHAGAYVVGGTLNEGETMQEKLGPGVYSINGSTTSYFDGRATTHTAARSTSYAVPVAYLRPDFGLFGLPDAPTNVIALTALKNPPDLPILAQQPEP
jgi:hypothetical protein